MRDSTGNLENLYVRVSSYRLLLLWGIGCANSFDQVDRAKVLQHGREAAGKLLIELQVRKSTADGAGAREYYTELTKPSEGWAGEIRDIVLKKKLVRTSFRVNLVPDAYPFFRLQPRKVFVQPNTVIVNGEAELKDYPLTAAGLIQSYVERNI